MAAPNMVDVDPAAVAGPGPGAAPPPVAPVAAGGPGMPAMPGVTVSPGPKGPNFDPTGTVPVAGSPADPNHPAQQAPPVAPVAPKMAEEAADREFKAKSEVADVDQKIADNAVKSGEADETRQAKEAELRKAQVAEQEKEDARQAAGIAKATAERDRLQANVQDFKFHNFWDDKSTGQKILAGIGIILGSASYGQNHVNQAAASIDNAIANEWEQQKAELVKRRDDAQAAGADLTELQRQYKEDSGRLALRQEAQLKALADEMDALASHSKNQAGILAAQKIAAEARAAAEAQGAAGVKAIAAAHSEALKDEETKAQTAEALAKAGKLARKGGGANGSSPAFSAFVDAAGKLKPGEAIPGNVAVLAAKAGIKAKDIADQVNKYRNSGSLSETDANKAAGKGPGGRPLLVVRDVDGKPLGVAQNPRGIEKIKEDVRKFTRAIKVLKEEQGKAGFFQNKNNPAFHNAVLAVAAASNAGVSVESMHHEEGTLTNALGRPDKEAIQAKIEELTGNLNAITNQLDPLPEGYVDAKEENPGSGSKLNDAQKANLPSGWSVAN